VPPHADEGRDHPAEQSQACHQGDPSGPPVGQTDSDRGKDQAHREVVDPQRSPRPLRRSPELPTPSSDDDEQTEAEHRAEEAAKER